MRLSIISTIRSGLSLFAGFVAFFMIHTSSGQSLGINSTGSSPDPSAAMDIQATNQGLLVPRVALTATNSGSPVVSPAVSLLVYNTATAGTPPHQVQPGYYFWNGTQWVKLSTENATVGWGLTGNAGTNSTQNFIGTTDNQPLVFKANNQKVAKFPVHPDSSLFIGFQTGLANQTGMQNTTLGSYTLLKNTFGNGNTAIGAYALWENTTGYHNTGLGAFTLYKNTNGSKNIAIGAQALFNNTTGESNIAIGNGALYFATTYSNVVAIGDQALYNNGKWGVGGHSNTAVGSMTLKENTSGYSNTAVGTFALRYNTSGELNSAFGTWALGINSTGSANTAVGSSALNNNTSGFRNTAVGSVALLNNTIGYFNSALGASALANNISGSNNIAMGFEALYDNRTANNNTALGTHALRFNQIGSSNVAVGTQALYKSNENNNTAIGDASLSNSTSGWSNTAVGSSSLVNNISGSTNTSIGYFSGPKVSDLSNTGAMGAHAAPTASNHYRIGNTEVTNIGGQVGWSTYSDQRFKVQIAENVKGLEFILKLRPVTYHWDIDSLNRYIYGKAADSLFSSPVSRNSIAEQEHIAYTGFLAQEVEKAAQSAGYDFSGVTAPANDHSPYSIRYAEFVVPLVKAVQEQQSQIGQQSQLLTGLTSRLDRPVIRLASANEWADRVFEKGYQLRPLDEVERYFQQHKHLPGVPSAHTLAEEGVDVTSMLAKQMEKIEELTLYLLELTRKNEELTQKNKKIDQLEALVLELQKKVGTSEK